ncbi:MAG: hypothetical protein IRY83_08925 [Chloroflexi bacterium]|nr:hypothetical protein [Chloroflexota bacterium]
MTVRVSRTTAVALQMIATATNLTLQAEQSVSSAVEAAEQIVAAVVEMSAALSRLGKVHPLDLRVARQCVRRARYRVRCMRDQARTAAEATWIAQMSAREISDLMLLDSPPTADVLAVVEKAMKAAGRAERAARLARAHLWEGHRAALTAAQLLDRTERATQDDGLGAARAREADIPRSGRA